MTRSSSEIGSTSNSTSGALHDVFLSFRGDTRLKFTDSVYHALQDKGICVFIDKKGIDVGDRIGPKIYQAINDSKICIPILSADYASSRWCLRELEHMMKREKTHGLEVLPIFHDVEPSVVKLEIGEYRNALSQHKKELGAESVRGWEEALKEVTKIKGWDTKNIGHGELARQIALHVFHKLKGSREHLSNPLVEIDESEDEVTDMSRVESEDVKLIGICGIGGIGGIGKTTLAVYNKLSGRFQSSSFILKKSLNQSSSFILKKSLNRRR